MLCRYIHENVILAMHKELVVDTVLILVENINEPANRDLNLLLLEIFYLLFRNQNPKLIVHMSNHEKVDINRANLRKGGKGTSRNIILCLELTS